MKKSISDRIKITKTGKILRRAIGQNHFRAKKSSTQLRRRSLFRGLNSGEKITKKYL